MILKIAHNADTARSLIPTNWRIVLDAFPPHLLEEWEERAAIIQYDGGEPRPTAERRAFECIIHGFAEAQELLNAQKTGRSKKQRKAH